MPTQDARLNALLSTFNVTGSRYIGQSLAEALRVTHTPEGSTASERAVTAAAKAGWDAAEKALTEYQASAL